MPPELHIPEEVHPEFQQVAHEFCLPVLPGSRLAMHKLRG